MYALLSISKLRNSCYCQCFLIVQLSVILHSLFFLLFVVELACCPYGTDRRANKTRDAA